RPAAGPAGQAPETGEVDEPPDEVRNDHPGLVPVKVDVLAGQDARCEIDGGKNEHEDSREDDHVHHEGGEPRGEPRVVTLQALPSSSQQVGGYSITRASNHNTAKARYPPGKQGAQRKSRRQTSSTRQAQNSTTQTTR